MFSGLELHKYKNELLLSILGAAALLLVSSFVLYGIIFFIASLVFLIYGEKLLIPLSLVLLLVISREDIGAARDIINFLLIAAVFVYAFHKDKLSLKKLNAFPKEINVLLIFITISFFLSLVFTGANPVSIAAFIRTIIFFLFCYVLYSLLEDDNGIHELIFILQSVSLIAGISIYYEIYDSGFSMFLIKGELARYTGIYDNPNYVGLLAFITACLIIPLFYSKKFTSAVKRFYLIFFLINDIAVLFITGSRAAIVGFIISSVFILAYLDRKLLYKSVAVLLTAFIILINIPAIQELIDLYLRFNGVGSREFLWNAGVEMFSDYPIFGIGPDLFAQKFYTYLPSSASYLHEIAFGGGRPHPHNFYLLLAAENGFLGLISSILFFAVLLYLGFKNIKKAKSENYEYWILSIAFTGIFLGVMVRGFFEVVGILTYGYLSRDLPLWIAIISSAFIYKNLFYTHSPSQLKNI